ncbi:molybdopterin-guanine dinucleotide biosynthesis protein [Enemella dayhoffiae]|uniref:Molybdopterin-guanine dinucleotide biosynthesis protein n=1 Tax=Enemella dayhoffiae TaxID=2016507 RepID=A0A255H727_9ACTN|nr:DUF6457 domain-containing protein [Enemella dayhoffiae]OYO23116.1 molybdopterin-guanine dinucleotide biosynthesis protein [Enemella dayhoffiae]
MSEEPVGLQQWVDTLGAHLGTDYQIDEESMHILLDLARDAAHEIVRPAAPLTAFLVGVAVGRGQSLGSAAARATELAQSLGEAADA